MTCPACGAESLGTGAVCAGCGDPLPLGAGSVVASRYEIEARLGKGGMGTVYRARDLMLGEQVALKVLNPDLGTTPSAAERFRSEIRLARKVTHRNVCRIHDYGEEGPLRFISMKFIDGEDLRQVLRRRGGLPPEEAFEVAIQTADGLQAIHDEGIIHRDLKSPNIMRDGRGVARLMDFGIAKQWQEGEGGGLTMTGQIVGTPEYMSPEQVRGEKLDFRSDVYALGIVAFELFTGKVPFKAETPFATIMMQLEASPPLEGERARGIPEPVLAVLRRALAKDPKDRFDSAREMGEALRTARASTLARLSPATGASSPASVAGATTAVPVTTAPPTATKPRVPASHLTVPGGAATQISAPPPRFAAEVPLAPPARSVREDARVVPPTPPARKKTRPGLALTAGAGLLLAFLAYVWLGGPLPGPFSPERAGSRPTPHPTATPHPDPHPATPYPPTPSPPTPPPPTPTTSTVLVGPSGQPPVSIPIRPSAVPVTQSPAPPVTSFPAPGSGPASPPPDTSFVADLKTLDQLAAQNPEAALARLSDLERRRPGDPALGERRSRYQAQITAQALEHARRTVAQAEAEESLDLYGRGIQELRRVVESDPMSGEARRVMAQAIEAEARLKARQVLVSFVLSETTVAGATQVVNAPPGMGEVPPGVIIKKAEAAPLRAKIVIETEPVQAKQGEDLIVRYCLENQTASPLHLSDALVQTVIGQGTTTGGRIQPRIKVAEPRGKALLLESRDIWRLDPGTDWKTTLRVVLADGTVLTGSLQTRR